MVDLETLGRELPLFNEEDPRIEDGYLYPDAGIYRVSKTGWIEAYQDEMGYWYKLVSPDDITAIARHVAPPEPVTLTAEERNSLGNALVFKMSDASITDDLLAWLTERGFALVRTKAVADGA